MSLKRSFSVDLRALSTLCLRIVASKPGDTRSQEKAFSVATMRFHYIMFEDSRIAASVTGLQ